MSNDEAQRQILPDDEDSISYPNEEQKGNQEDAEVMAEEFEDPAESQPPAAAAIFDNAEL